MNSNAPSSLSYRLIASQGLNAFGDHCAKITVSGLIAAVFPERQAAVFVGVVSALYVIPYILLAPVAGRLSSRFSKTKVVRGSLLLQAAAMSLISVSALLESLVGILTGLALVACQSSFLAPSRNALLKELCGTERIGQMMGLLGLAGVGATLAGLALGGWSFDQAWGAFGTPWSASAAVSGASAVFAFLSYVVVKTIRSENETERETSSPFVSVLKEVMVRPELRWPSLGLSWFYGVGAMLVMILLQDSRWEHGQEMGSASQGGAMAAFLGLGVAIGSGWVAYLCRKRVEVGLSFLGALLLVVFVPMTALSWDRELLAAVGVFAMGLAGGLFSAPLNALFVSRARDEARVGSIAANNLVINLLSAGFVGAASLMGYIGWSPVNQLWIVAGTAVIVLFVMIKLIPESFVRLVSLGIVRVLYPMKTKGLENLPTTGGVLLVANHVSYADALLISAASPRPVRFMGTSEMLRFPLMRWMYRKFNVIAVSPQKAKEAISKTAAALKAGDVVCVFPEGALTRTGMVMPFKKGVELMSRLSKAPIVPGYIDGMWGSPFSFSGEPFSYRKGMPLRRRISLVFGEKLEGDDVSASQLQQKVTELGVEAFSERRELKKSLGVVLLRNLKKNPLKPMLKDRGIGAEMSNCKLSAAGLWVADYLRKEVPNRRVGVLLPPGVAGFVFNLGAIWSGKSPVNLNPTASAESFGEMIEAAGVGTVITSQKLLGRFPNLEFGATRLVFVEDLLPRMRGIRSVVAAVAFVLLPAKLISKLYQVSNLGGDAEATLLFSSGSSAKPKGIPLSHRNLIANVNQISEVHLFEKADTILANLPLFHSFGLTGGFLLPLIKGIRIVATPSPLAARENIAAVREDKVTVLLGTPTFLRPYVKLAKKEDLESLRFAIAGAEKLPAQLATQWQERFAKPIFEGYGMTECAPVISLNCSQSSAIIGRHPVKQCGAKTGTVGRPAPGVAIRIVDEVDCRTPKPRGESGLILVKGANVFGGYLGGLEKSRLLEDGWLNTGDMGSFDEDGCLLIEGRLTRFSKVGGEMVSHGAVERAIEASYPELVESEEVAFFVGAVECERKGEALVLLTRSSIRQSDLVQRLKSRGLPNLWMPQHLIQVAKLPMLGTGKIDMKACQSICREAVDTASAA